MIKYAQNLRQAFVSIGAVAIFGLWVSSSPKSFSADNEGPGGSTPAARTGDRVGPSSPAVEEYRGDSWLNLGFSNTYTGPRVRIAIGELKDRTGTSVSFGSGGDFCRVPMVTTRNLLTTALAHTGRFDVAELEVSDPLHRAKDGMVEPSRGGDWQERTRSSGIPGGFQYLITGSVNDWRFNSGGAGVEIRHGRVGERSVAAAMCFRVADARTGQILYATSEQAEIGLGNVDSGGTFNSGWSESMSAAIRSAIEACIYRAAHRFAGWFVDRPWTGTVSAVEPDRIIIGAGRHQGMRAGMILGLLSRSRRLIDPETGLVLGAVTEKTGRLRMVEVRDQSSIAEVVDGCDGVKPGDRVELQL